MVSKRYHFQLVSLILTAPRLQSFQSTIFLSPNSLVRTARSMSNENDSAAYGVGLRDIGTYRRKEQPSREDDSEVIKSWRSLLEVSSSKSRKIRGSNYVQLATVDPETNEPRCRTVVFRGFQKLSSDHGCSNICDGMSCVMKIITDSRSQKVQQITHGPTRMAEMVWWFPKTSEQYRIRGELLFVGAGQFEKDDDKQLISARKEQWGNLSESARESFFVKATPGMSYSDEPENDIPTGGRDQVGHLLPPPDHFLLVLLIPKHCDYLRLTNMYRQIDEYMDGQWKSVRVNP
jgi:hypothetical protein